jgi:hypothetical protein
MAGANQIRRRERVGAGWEKPTLLEGTTDDAPHAAAAFAAPVADTAVDASYDDGAHTTCITAPRTGCGRHTVI